MRPHQHYTSTKRQGPQYRGFVSMLVAATAALLLSSCSTAEPPRKMVVQELEPLGSDLSSYEECVAAGNMTTRSYPPRCITSDGRSFTKVVAGTARPTDLSPSRPDPSAQGTILSFEDCVAAGHAIRRTLPATCADAAGRVFTEGRPGVTRIDRSVLSPQGMDGSGRAAPEVCKNLCGDGVCQEIVCMAVGCPCPESPANCPKDCGAR